MAGRLADLEEVGGERVAARLRHLDDLDGEVVAAEAVDEECRVGEVELGDDVVLDGWRGGCGEGDDGGGAESGEVFAQGAVVGAKVVAPGGDAVGFVDGDERGLACVASISGKPGTRMRSGAMKRNWRVPSR